MFERNSSEGFSPELLAVAGQALFDPARTIFEWDGNRLGVQTTSTIGGLPSYVRVFDEVAAQETGVAVEWQFYLPPPIHPGGDSSNVTHVYFLDGRSSIIIRHDSPEDTLVSLVNAQGSDVVQELKPVDHGTLASLKHILSAHHSHPSA